MWYAVAITPFEPQPLAPIPSADAPFVLWDVVLDLLDYPEFYNTQMDGHQVTQDSDFWYGLIEVNFQTVGGVFSKANHNEIRLRLTQGESTLGAIAETEGESSTGSNAIICSQLGAAVTTNEKGTDGQRAAQPPSSVGVVNTSSEGSESEGRF
ncbi:unnamed protein product [Eruca vesicaria subsp. sativa]|uniref:Coenzyme Q-binding protein COQ10 START domain-containing protein n=1 Tax=Eruca vesicaria subsp. sativa TaxID=29727 RepID=A0ABC8K7Q8_ERUVS|nr:unnamed protein product [Eruca vesicaria subsp. sativa]